MKLRNGHRRVLWVVAVGVLVLAAVDSAGQDWPQFRGVHRDGISPETGLRGSWPEAGPKEVWRRPLGEGFSAISVVDGKLYTMYTDDHEGQKTEFAAAFDAAGGKELWRVPIGENYDTEFGNGPRATPSVDGDTVYVLGSLGDLAALSVKDGSERWRIKLTETFGGEKPYFGFSSSALVDGDQLIIDGGGPEGKSHAGLDKATGKVRWTVGDGPAGYSSPLAIDMNGKRRYVYVVNKKLTAIDDKGNEIWSHPWPEGETHAMPLFLPPNRIFASGAEGVGAALVEVSEKGNKATVEEVWQTRFMRNHFSSSVVHEGHIYGFDNATLKCINAEDGELAWAKRGFGKGSLILADGRLVVLSDRGQLLLLEASPAGYVEHGSVQALEGRCWTAPTLSGGKLYLRNHEEMVVYDVKG